MPSNYSTWSPNKTPLIGATAPDRPFNLPKLGGSDTPAPLPGFQLPQLPNGPGTVSVPPGTGGMNGFGMDGSGLNLDTGPHSTFDWGGIIGSAITLLPSLFGSNPGQQKANRAAGTLEKEGAALGKQGKAITQSGQQALAPVLEYLKSVVGGDPAALQMATAPERALILDQYDTAKRTIANSAARGGGANAAIANLEGEKASTLVTTLANARNNATAQLGTIGMQQTNAGVGAQYGGLQAIESALQAYEQEAARRAQTNRGFGGFLGDVLGGIFKVV